MSDILNETQNVDLSSDVQLVDTKFRRGTYAEYVKSVDADTTTDNDIYIIGGNSDVPEGVQNDGPLRLYVGNQTVVPVLSKNMTVGGILYNAGTPIEDVISSSTGTTPPTPDDPDDPVIAQPSVLTEELTTTTSVGFIENGTTYQKGTSLEDILRNLLSKELFPTAATVPIVDIKFNGYGTNTNVTQQKFVGDMVSIPEVIMNANGGHFNPSWANPGGNYPYTKFTYGALSMVYINGFTGLEEYLTDNDRINSIITTPDGFSDDSITLSLSIHGQYEVVRGANGVSTSSRATHSKPYTSTQFDTEAYPVSSIGTIINPENQNFQSDMTWTDGVVLRSNIKFTVNGMLKIYTNGLYQSNNPGVTPDTGYPDETTGAYINKVYNTNTANNALVIEHIACLGGRQLWIKVPSNMSLSTGGVKSYDSDKRVYSNNVSFNNIGNETIDGFTYNVYECNTNQSGSNTYQFTFKVAEYTE